MSPLPVLPSLGAEFFSFCAAQSDPTRTSLREVAGIAVRIRKPFYNCSLRDSQEMVNTSAPVISKPVLARVAAGESGAMNVCINHYGPIVWTLVRRYINNSATSEDLVQEIFTEIWKKAATYDSTIASESTFIGMIARRRAIDFLRRQGRNPGFEPLEVASSFPDPALETSSIPCDTEALKSSLETLPEETRKLFHLFFDDGFTHPEIADKTGLPLGTVKTRLRRGLLALRDHLKRAGITNTYTAS